MINVITVWPVVDVEIIQGEDKKKNKKFRKGEDIYSITPSPISATFVWWTLNSVCHRIRNGYNI